MTIFYLKDFSFFIYFDFVIPTILLTIRRKFFVVLCFCVQHVLLVFGFGFDFPLFLYDISFYIVLISYCLSCILYCCCFCYCMCTKLNNL